MQGYARTVHAHAQGPLSAEARGDRIEVSSYASEAVLEALGPGESVDGRPPAATPAPVPAASEARGRVLLVEDNTVNRMVAEQLLRVFQRRGRGVDGLPDAGAGWLRRHPSLARRGNGIRAAATANHRDDRQCDGR
ncbi:hypothetical protein G6F66_014080 [Rhizopus arrhizus]|nr:hypothetical protein G6F66_014080 [Rhizopus arrhizus]